MMCQCRRSALFPVSPDVARFSAAIRGLYRPCMKHPAQELMGEDPGYSTRERRAEFRETEGVGCGVSPTKGNCQGWHP
jgi:hypothetical protein